MAEPLEDMLPLDFGHRALREVLREVEGDRLEDERDRRIVVVVGVVELDGKVGAQVAQQLQLPMEVRLPLRGRYVGVRSGKNSSIVIVILVMMVVVVVVVVTMAPSHGC